MDLSRLKPEYVCITDEQVEFLNEVIKSKNPQNKVTKIDVTNLYEEEFMFNFLYRVMHSDDGGL